MVRDPTPSTFATFSDDELDKYCQDNEGQARQGQRWIAIRCHAIIEEVPAELKKEIEDRLRSAATRVAATPEVKSLPIRLIWCDPPWRHNYESPPLGSDSLDDISPQKFHPQAQSPLFKKLSPELRHQVFTLVLAEYEDFANRYQPEDEATVTHFCDYYRPGWMAPWRIDWALLLTCQRAYYEAGHLPMRLATHRFCLDVPKPRKGTSSDSSKLGEIHISDLTKANLNNVTSIHIQASGSWLKGSRKIYLSSWEQFRGPDPFPNLMHLTVTISWASWFPDYPAALYLDDLERDSWPEVKKRLRFEFEVADWKDGHVNDLDKLVDELRGGKLHMETINGTPLVPDTMNSPKKWKWSMLFPDGVEDYDYTNYRIGVDHPNPVELIVATVDYIPATAPTYAPKV